MKFSIITPTHDTKYLPQLYASLKAQQGDVHWEWIIVPNGDAYLQDLPDGVGLDDRVIIIDAPADLEGKIGALKLEGFTNGEGDYLVEVDHDDLLTPDALQTMEREIRAREKETGKRPDFMYSSFVEFKEDGTTNNYSQDFGWEHEEFEINYTSVDNLHIKGHAMIAFDPTPASLSRIEFAPNHVRCWERQFYNRIGGHDSLLEVADDYDLVVRSYIEGGDFLNIHDALYLYRLRGDNTFLQRNAEIQQKQRELSNMYQVQVIDEWAKRSGLPKIDLGGAHNSPEGYESVDYQDADHNCDISEGLPFEDNSVSVVRAIDFLEHIPSCKNSGCKHEAGECVVGVMKEIYRVLAPNGVLLSATPSTDGRGAYQDPTHISFHNQNSFWYYCNKSHQQYLRDLGDMRFNALQLYTHYPNKFCRPHDISYVVATLVAIKDEVVAGEPVK